MAHYITNRTQIISRTNLYNSFLYKYIGRFEGKYTPSRDHISQESHIKMYTYKKS